MASDDSAQTPETLIGVSVKGLILDPSSNVPIVILRETGGERFLPIWIGDFEAHAIACALEGIESPRPMSHDLMAALVEGLEGEIERIVVCDLQEGTFFAQVFLSSGEGGAAAVLDARPSDAIALGLRVDAPIFVDAEVFVKARDVDLANRLTDEEKIKKWLEEVDPDDLGKYTM